MAERNTDTTDQAKRKRLSPSPPLIAAVVLLAMLAVGLAVAGILTSGQRATGPAAVSTPAAAATGPVALAPVAAPQASTAACAKLLAALPSTVTNGGSVLARARLVAPAPTATVAWGSPADPLVLRCGVEQPLEFTATSEVLGVDGVQWFTVSSSDAQTWYTVDRPVTIALTLPRTASTGPIQDVSAAIATALPAVALHPNGG